MIKKLLKIPTLVHNFHFCLTWQNQGIKITSNKIILPPTYAGCFMAERKNLNIYLNKFRWYWRLLIPLECLQGLGIILEAHPCPSMPFYSDFIQIKKLAPSKCLSKWMKVDKWDYFQNGSQEFFSFNFYLSFF